MSCCNNDTCLTPETSAKLKNVFIAVLAINAVLFIVEFAAGIISRSTALTADSLDMLADAFVYGISLYVLNKNELSRVKASLVKGTLMSLLAVYVVVDSVLKVFSPIEPAGNLITGIGILAIIANALCLYLLHAHKAVDLNTRSAWICSRNDVIANVSVIFAGMLVSYLDSKWPDIIIGTGIALFVLQSSLLIVQESWERKKQLEKEN
jgi:Co/Zn/Cd efflux system component